MKILHTADWHLGKRLDFFPRLEEQRAVLEEICRIADAEQVDAILVAGDLFDTFNPPVEAVELLYKTLKKLSNNGKRPVIAIAGNHDSADRIDAPDSLARESGILFIGSPQAHLPLLTIEDGFSITRSDKGFLEIKLPQYPYPLRVIHTAFANELRLKQYLGLKDKAEELNNVLSNTWAGIANQYCDDNGVNLLTAHLYMLRRGGPQLEEPDGEKPIKIGNADIVYSDGIPNQIQYTALGHLHRFQDIAGHASPVVYSSSPLAYSFSEAGQTKQVVIIDAEPKIPVRYRPIALKSGRQLYRKRFEDLDLAVAWLQDNPYALVELTLVSEQFISAIDLKRIQEAHDGIIHIIPVVKQSDVLTESAGTINLEQDVDQLFKDFFIHKLGQEANPEIMDLLKEVMSSTNERED